MKKNSKCIYCEALRKELIEVWDEVRKLREFKLRTERLARSNQD